MLSPEQKRQLAAKKKEIRIEEAAKRKAMRIEREIEICYRRYVPQQIKGYPELVKLAQSPKGK